MRIRSMSFSSSQRQWLMLSRSLRNPSSWTYDQRKPPETFVAEDRVCVSSRGWYEDRAGRAADSDHRGPQSSRGPGVRGRAEDGRAQASPGPGHAKRRASVDSNLTRTSESMSGVRRPRSRRGAGKQIAKYGNLSIRHGGLVEREDRGIPQSIVSLHRHRLVRGGALGQKGRRSEPQSRRS